MKMGAAAPISEFGSGEGSSGFLPPHEFLVIPKGDRRRRRPGHADTFYKAADLRTVNSDIGKRMIVERHQLGISPFPASPVGHRPLGRNEQVYYGHSSHSCARFCCTAQELVLHRRKGKCMIAIQPCRGAHQRAWGEKEERKR